MTTVNGVSEQWQLGLTIGGKDYPIANPETIPELLIFESVHMAVPSLNMTFKDYTGEYGSAVAAGDGVKIELTLGDGRGGTYSGTFNIQGSPQVSHGAGYSLIKINAVLDALHYLRAVASGLYEGGSGAVIGQIAAQSGLKPIIGSSADAQVWLPSGKTMFGFAKDIMNHGYRGSNSLMTLGVSLNKELIYGDVNELIQSGNKTVGVDAKQGQLLIEDWNGSSNGMVTNNSRGYGSTTFAFGEDGILSSLKKVEATLFGKIFGFSSANAGLLGDFGARLDPRARPAGNTHPKYLEAEHQNTRMRAIWSNDLNVLLHTFSGIRLLEGVNALPPNFGAAKINEVFSGRYILTARTMGIVGAKYSERLTLTTNGGG